MFEFKVFKYVSFELFSKLWVSLFDFEVFDYIDWLSSKLVTTFFVAVDTDNVSISTPSDVYVVWVPGVTFMPLNSEWLVYQNGDIAVFSKTDFYFNKIIREDSDSIMFKIKESSSDLANDERVGSQLSFLLSYFNGLSFGRLIDLGSGDSNLSDRLKHMFGEKYVPLDPKLGHDQLYINSIIIDAVDDLVLMRNSLHHFSSLDVLSNINSKFVMIIDYFEEATTYVSIHHLVYKEVFICWNIESIKFNLKQFNFVRLMDEKLNLNGPSCYLFSTYSDVNINLTDIFSSELVLNFYDMQFIDENCHLLDFNINSLIIKKGMLRGLVDFFFNYRLPFKISDFIDSSEYLSNVSIYITNNVEVKPDDINMWISILSNIKYNVCDPFSGWCSRLLAFSIIKWNDQSAKFYWFDFDPLKVESTLRLIKYLKSSGCLVDFILITDSIIVPQDVLIVTSPFYLNFEGMYGRSSLLFENVSSWADYVIGFINLKCRKVFPCLLQMNNYKGYNLADELFSRIPYGSKFRSVNDLGYFRFKVDFKTVIYGSSAVENVSFGLTNKIDMHLIEKAEAIQVYKYNLLGFKLEIQNNLINSNCSINICGHFGHQNNYIEGMTIHSGQLKLLNLIIGLNANGYTYIIYIGSGNGFSVLTDTAIEYLANRCKVKFLLIDKYTVIPKKLNTNNVTIFNGFLTEDNWLEIINIGGYSESDNILILSDVRSFKDVNDYEYSVRRASEFNKEVLLYNKILKYMFSRKLKVDICLKINYSPIKYKIPSVGLFLPIGITGEFRIIIYNSLIDCDLEMSDDVFNALISSMLTLQFSDNSKICAYCKFFDSLDI